MPEATAIGVATDCLHLTPASGAQVLCAPACSRQTAACCLVVQLLRHHWSALQVLQRLRHVKGVTLEVAWRPLRALLRRQLLARTQTYESERPLLWSPSCILPVLKHALLSTSPYGMQCRLAKEIVLAGFQFLLLSKQRCAAPQVP